MMITEQTLQELAKQFGLVFDWGNENVIPYLQDLANRVVTYEFYSSIFYTIVGIIIILIGIIIFKIISKSDDAEERGWGIIIFIAFLATGCGIIGKQINDIIICKTIPEKILLQYIKST